MTTSGKIGLALSGGGVRAMVFHAGVLKWLAEQNKLEYITDISTVSGGSLFTGLVFRISGWKWPSSQEYLTTVLPEIRQLLTKNNLQKHATLLLICPCNWRYLFSRANVLAMAIEELWDVRATLQEVPNLPVWSANGTTAETGRRFRFKKGKCGDYELGEADAQHFKVSEAMAASAAFPLLIGPLSVDATSLQWYKRLQWGDAPGSEQPITPPFQRLHIMDGGVYDNLGMEPIFDVGKQKLKSSIERLIVSDAGAPLKRAPLPPQFHKGRAKRIVDITMDQARALRVRALVNFIQENPEVARYIQLGSNPRRVAAQYKGQVDENMLSEDQWLPDEMIQASADWPTDLNQLTESTFELIARHGYETAKWNDLLFLRHQ
ncbi:MAG: patatin-like phospholipase family protein [Methylobacter sp.]|nr:patatin-like phospholipase family protein [Methylobacter sp.]